MGRHSSYTYDIARQVCERLAAGESLKRICEDDTMPDRETVRRWMIEHEDFAARCAQARAEQAEYHHEQMDEIEAQVLSGDLNPQAASVVLANKRWRMEKLKPRVYGAKVAIEHSGGIKTGRDLSDDELARIASTGGGGTAGEA